MADSHRNDHLTEQDAVRYAVERATRDEHDCAVWRVVTKYGSTYYVRHADSSPPWTKERVERVAWVTKHGRVTRNDEKKET